MKRFQRHWATKWITLFLAIFLLWGNQWIFPRETRLKGLFQMVLKNYLEGRYREVIKDLGLLLSYCDEQREEHKELRGKIYLLLGAVYEQLGNLREARKNYQLSRELLENPSIEGIDLTYLKEYQHIIMDKQKPVAPGVIEKPAAKKKKPVSLLYLVLGGVVIAGVVTVLVLNKKKQPQEIEFVPDYDTRELGIEWVQVPAGEFMMGDNFNEGDGNEQPVHAVYLSEYFISRYEVTFEQYDRYTDEIGWSKPYDQGWGRGNRPVINVTWNAAGKFCEWLSQKTRKNIHLPTEAQWEKAARGTDQRRYPWGNSPPDCTKANYGCDNQTHPVGSHPAGVSPYGLHDMAGNVSEWCQDGYLSVYYSDAPYHNPVYIPENIDTYTRFVIRGGSWDTAHEVGIRSADRGRYSNIGSNYVGFRLVMER
ncbi:MAG: SUMF1/EgtB/PvdO family nonheme iron enzyme [Candidatus Aminicenantes bacterium]|nr:MAG: SUMF1/EgtB/PvdO family nonheme iron enzyme [Candidatus Aminicenantes bacterium]